MVRDLGVYEGIKMFYDSDMHDMNIVFGNAKKKLLPNGDVIKPLDLYKESVDKESLIMENENFRLPTINDYKRKVSVTWIVGGPEDEQVYKDAIDYIKHQFDLI